MHTARIPPVDPAPATITAVLAMHAGHICPSSEFTQLSLCCPARKLRTGAAAPWLLQRASPPRWTLTWYPRISPLPLSPLRQRSLPQQTPDAPSACPAPGTYLCPRGHARLHD